MEPEPVRLRLYPDPVLGRRGEAIKVVDDRVRGLAREMFQIMYDEGGIGLAAPQVGRLQRLFVVNLTGDPARGEEERIFVNPVLLAEEGRASSEEGCLSLPGIRAEVARAEKIRVAATDLSGARFELEASELLARCIQHELDHLDGILFVKRLPMTVRMSLRKDLKELERKFEEQQPAPRRTSKP